jgi:hypothetical protein
MHRTAEYALLEIAGRATASGGPFWLIKPHDIERQIGWRHPAIRDSGLRIAAPGVCAMSDSREQR